MRRRRLVDAWLLAAALVAVAISQANAQSSRSRANGPRQKILMGWVELVVLGERELRLEAKLDTGADTSSLDATSIRRLRRKSSEERFVEFKVLDPDSGELVDWREPLVRMAVIKRHSGRPQRRPVVELEICVGTISKRVEFTLVSRSQFEYPVLLGREALGGAVVVDSELTHTSPPACEGLGDRSEKER